MENRVETRAGGGEDCCEMLSSGSDRATVLMTSQDPRHCFPSTETTGRLPVFCRLRRSERGLDAYAVSVVLAKPTLQPSVADVKLMKAKEGHLKM